MKSVLGTCICELNGMGLLLSVYVWISLVHIWPIGKALFWMWFQNWKHAIIVVMFDMGNRKSKCYLRLRCNGVVDMVDTSGGLQSHTRSSILLHRLRRPIPVSLNNSNEGSGEDTECGRGILQKVKRPMQNAEWLWSLVMRVRKLFKVIILGKLTWNLINSVS